MRKLEKERPMPDTYIDTPTHTSEGLYRARFEHDACGIGALAHLKGRRSHQMIDDALSVLVNLEHRGGVGLEKNTGDGAGMNLLNLAEMKWDAEICDFTAPGLLAKLPAVALPGGKTSLALAPYFAKYGLRAGIPVVPFTGDNPASLVGTGADKPGIAVVSLGTSDTFFAAMPEFRTDPDGYGHVFGNPAGGFMSLSCFKNGSLARDRVRRDCGVDWTFFDETAFALTPSGNGGKRAFPYFETELTPKHDATGIEANFDWDAAAPEVKIRAVVEGQVANMRERTRWIGDFKTIYVTGGASRSKGILTTIREIFGAEVRTLDVSDSAAVGGAILAARAVR
jgi:xylulokinase